MFEGCAGLAGAEPQAEETGRMEPTTSIGLEVHKRITSVALAESGRGGEVRLVGAIPSTPEALRRHSAHASS